MRSVFCFIALVLPLNILFFLSCKTHKQPKNACVSLEPYKNFSSDFNPCYKVVKVEDYSFDQEVSGIDAGKVVRKIVRITVPKGLDSTALVSNLKHALVTQCEKCNPDQMSVFAYQEGSSVYDNFTAGKAEIIEGEVAIVLVPSYLGLTSKHPESAQDSIQNK
jgi:hypothetical protein